MVLLLTGYTKMVELLLENNANIDALGEYGKTALVSAAERGHVETVKLLLQKGAEVDAVNSSGNTLLFSLTSSRK